MCMQVLRRFWTFGLWWDGRRLPVHQVLVRLKSISRYFRFYITNHFKLISFKVLNLNKITKYPGPGISTCKHFGLWLSQFHFSKSEISKCLSESKLNSLVVTVQSQALSINAPAPSLRTGVTRYLVWATTPPPTTPPPTTHHPQTFNPVPSNLEQ